MTDTFRVSAEQARAFCIACLGRAGVPGENAESVADSLVLANLRGVDSHGILRLPIYVEGIRRGFVQPSSDIRVVEESASITMLDGGNGLGILVALKATDLAIEKARSTGLGVSGVRNLGHAGMLAYYMKRIVRHGFIGFACANTAAVMIPWGGRKNMFGTNPICIGFPGDGDDSMILDMATTVMAGLKIKMAAQEGKAIPEGVAYDKQGRPTTDAREALEGFQLPFGGHKGYGLAMVVEMLSSALLGALQSRYIEKHPSTQGGFFVAVLDVGRFRAYADYRKDASHLIHDVESCPPADGFSEVLIPGQLEERETEKRMRDGIPIDAAMWKKLGELAEELSVKPPAELHSL